MNDCAWIIDTYAPQREDESSWHSDHPTPLGILVLTINQITARKVLGDKCGVFAEQLMQMHLAFPDFVYGHVSTEEAWDAQIGTLYTNYSYEPHSEALANIERSWWKPTTDRLRRMKDVYWGNIWNKHLWHRVRSSGLIDRIRNRYGDKVTFHEKDGGAFMMLSPTPTDAFDGSEKSEEINEIRQWIRAECARLELMQ